MPEYKTIQIDLADYKQLVELAEANGRTIKGQIQQMLKQYKEVLLYPEDAPRPVVYLERGE